jgi:hypothetical protein
MTKQNISRAIPLLTNPGVVVLYHTPSKLDDHAHIQALTLSPPLNLPKPPRSSLPFIGDDLQRYPPPDTLSLRNTPSPNAPRPPVPAEPGSRTQTS